MPWPTLVRADCAKQRKRIQYKRINSTETLEYSDGESRKQERRKWNTFRWQRCSCCLSITRFGQSPAEWHGTQSPGAQRRPPACQRGDEARNTSDWPQVVALSSTFASGRVRPDTSPSQSGTITTYQNRLCSGF